MDISNATALASAIVALVCPAIVQAVKKYIPSEYVGLFSLAVSIILGALAIAEDLDEAAERDWWTLFVETSAAHGWEDLPLGQISLDADNATDIQFEAPQQAAS